MRWALVRVCLAVTTLVTIAFAVPLGFFVREMAHDKALANAERQASALSPVLSITIDRHQLERAIASTPAGATNRMAVHLPANAKIADGVRMSLGATRATRSDIETARSRARISTASVDGGITVLQPTAISADSVAIVEVFVPHAEMSKGVRPAWLALAGISLVLLASSAVVADRLGVRLVQPARGLAHAAKELGQGNLGARVLEEGPNELRAAAAAFNSMADRVVQLLATERELAADLSHRLRTPLTVLRLNAASLGQDQAAEQTRAAVERLEGEVDTIIRTAREQRPQTRGGPSGSTGCDASEVILERMAFWSALAEDQGREVGLAGVDEPAHLPVSKPELAAALDAMLGNVFRHTPEGIAFSVDVHHADDAVIVLVSDAGDGIADPEAALQRGNEGEREGSTGLGLDIVRKLALSTGGDVRVGRSVLGGAEVSVRLGRDARHPRKAIRGRGRTYGIALGSSGSRRRRKARAGERTAHGSHRR